MSKAEFLMLAHKYDPDKDEIAGSYLSEKLDGCRCFWDGGISRGLPKEYVPWANTKNDERYNKTQICTGLWSRYGNIIHAPDFWLNKLPPNIFLDGELWCGRKKFQMLRSVVAKLPENREDDLWNKVVFMVIDSPHIDYIFKKRVIKTTQFLKAIDEDCLEFVKKYMKANDDIKLRPLNFDSVVSYLSTVIGDGNNSIKLHRQTKLSTNETIAEQQLNRALQAVYSVNGEGAILRKPQSIWVPERSHNLLKVKPYSDAEGIVVGYVTGRETDLGSKLLGLMGCMIINYNEIQFELSGFTDEERVLKTNDEQNRVSINSLIKTDKELTVYPDAFHWAYANAEKKCPDNITNPMFPRGSIVTFKYRELSDDGIPKEARYLRKE